MDPTGLKPGIENRKPVTPFCITLTTHIYSVLHPKTYASVKQIDWQVVSGKSLRGKIAKF